MQVRLYQLKYQVKVSVILGSNGSVQFDDVGVFELREETDLTVGALSVCRILECVKYFFESINVLGPAFESLPDVAIRPASHKFFGLKVSQNVLFDILAHRNRIYCLK